MGLSKSDQKQIDVGTQVDVCLCALKVTFEFLSLRFASS